jgi:hypothetical protein
MYKAKVIAAARKALKAFDDYNHWHTDWPAAEIAELRVAIESYDKWRGELGSMPITGGG